MPCLARFILSFLLLGLAIGHATATDWPHWRGPTSNGVAPDGPAPPLEWDESKNVIWSVPIPGRGHSSPTVVGDRIYLATADVGAGTQSLLAFDRSTGKPVWQTPVFENVTFPKIHSKNTHASSTVAFSDNKLFASFYGNGQIQTCAVSVEGKVLWRTTIGKFRQKYEFGYAASPVVYRNSVIMTCEAESETALVALNASNGKEIWRAKRPRNTSYSSPVLLNVAGREQLLISGNREIRSYNPASGKELWQAEGAAKHTAGTVTGDGDLVIASGGYPQSETFCVRADGTARVLWRNKQKCYEQSMLMHNGFVYAVTDGGIAFCWNATTGEEQWKKRLSGPVSVSPILVGDRIYATNEKGTTYIFSTDPKRFEALGKNQLGTSTFATPAFLDGRIYTRVASGEGTNREERLYCIGAE